MERKIYGICKRKDHVWSITSNKVEAKKIQKQYGGEIRYCSWGLWRDCGYSMDYPTFYAQSDLLI